MNGSKQFECKMCTLSGNFDARNIFWYRLNLLENILDAGFLCTIVLVCENWKKFQFACVVFYMNNILFLRKDGDMSMHAVILYHAVFGVKNGKKMYVVFLS